jgi:hypothetical protein
MVRLVKRYQCLQDDRGQSMIEFIVFIPILLIFYSIIMTISGAIHGSINQEKIVRSYYFALIHNDSYLPTAEILRDYLQNDNVRSAGMFSLGWRIRKEGEESIAPCYKLASFTADTTDEQCSPGNKTENKTRYIRVKTAFGLCTTSYVNFSGYFQMANNYPYGASSAAYDSCLNLK